MEGRQSLRYRAIGRQHLDRIPQLRRLDEDQRIALKAVAAVLPFRVNSYVLDELIDWENIPRDPIYQLTFPQAGMLERRDFMRMQNLVAGGASEEVIRKEAHRIRINMNPHPAGQMDLNVPEIEGERLPGAQHKYRETVLFFPSQGQTCHAYCTYCFRWAQFAGIEGLRFADREVSTLTGYLGAHPEVSDVLITGGDPMIMSTNALRRYLEPLLDPSLDHVSTIRIGTKALSYWPYRFLTDRDADDLLRLFERVVAAGRHLAIMAHFSHVRELETQAVERAMKRILATGAVIRCQAPLIRHVNDDPEVWAGMWRLQVQLGAVPYYMFVERDTGPKQYFEVPLARALRIFSKAYSQVSGLARTARGPSMSATPGKVLVDGVAEIKGEKVFVLKFIQARDPRWVNRIFFARFDDQATWLDELRPAFGGTEFFFEPALHAMYEGAWQPGWRRGAAAAPAVARDEAV